MPGKQDRAERLKAALRANLRRRKQPGSDPAGDAPQPDRDAVPRAPCGED